MALTRADRAIQLFLGHAGWTRVAEGVFRIPSSRHADFGYLVTPSTCDCPDFQQCRLRQEVCKHIMALRIYCQHYPQGDTMPTAIIERATPLAERAEPEARLYTARYSNPLLKEWLGARVKITTGHPRFKLPYTLTCTIPELAPHGVFGRGLTDQEFLTEYRARLDTFGVETIRAKLDQAAEIGGLPVVVLCFEDLSKPGVDQELACHRRMFANWWLEQTGELVPELLETAQINAGQPSFFP